MSIEQEIFGFHYSFEDGRLLKQALTHPSLNREGLDDYERLEFLGDRVLGLVITEYLYQTFPEDQEGMLAKKMATLVSKIALVKVAKAIDIGKHIDMSPGERKTGGGKKDSNLANALEAVIGALYLDAGLEQAEKFILSRWKDLLENLDPHDLGDAKSTLQEYVQTLGKGLPEYKLLKKEGEQHAPIFTSGVRLSKKDDFVEGRGGSKRHAEKDAARKLLAQLREEAP